MSSPNFDAMNKEDLHKYLKELGMSEDDAKILLKEKYNGKTVFLLEHSNEVLSKLSESSRLLLKLNVFAQKVQKQEKVDYPTHKFMARAESIVVPECVKFAMFGLGCGLDASNPSPLSCSAKMVTVRTIHPELNNVNEHIKRERHSYQETISSLNMHRSSVTASVSNIVGEVVTLRGEAEYKRENTNELQTSGEKEITRSLTFKPYCSHGAYTWPKDSEYESKFCSFLMHKIPEIESAAGSTSEEKVNNFLQESPDNFHQGLVTAYDYIKMDKITHYINGIELGAAIYSIKVSKSKIRKKKLAGEIGIDSVARMGSGVESREEQSVNERRRFSIGTFESLKRGGGEGVLEYSMLPLFTLVCDERAATRKVVQQAIRFYLDSDRGPFTISFMQEECPVYWKVESKGGRKTLTGTTSLDDAGIFYIDKHCRCGEFTISHYGETMKRTLSYPNMMMSNYISAKSKITSGRHVGPLLVKGRAAKFTLRHPVSRKSVPSIQEWEQDACYIKLAPRKTQLKSYIAFSFDGENGESMCVESPEKGEDKYLAMRFKLTRVEIGTCSRLFAAPTARTIDASDRLCSDSSEPDGATQKIERLNSNLFQGTETTSTENQNGTVSPQFSLEIQIAPEGGEDCNEDKDCNEDEEYESDISTDEDLDYDDSDTEF